MTGFGATTTQAARATAQVTPTTFTVERPDGSEVTYGSKLEALASIARNGGELKR